jgi:hypothetical protein
MKWSSGHYWLYCRLLGDQNACDQSSMCNVSAVNETFEWQSHLGGRGSHCPQFPPVTGFGPVLSFPDSKDSFDYLRRIAEARVTAGVYHGWLR